MTWKLRKPNGQRFLDGGERSVELFIKLIMGYSKKSDLIFSPFARSATDAIAALMVNRRWLGLEENSVIHSAAWNRIVNWYFQQQADGQVLGNFTWQLQNVLSNDYGSRAFLPLGPDNKPAGVVSLNQQILELFDFTGFKVSVKDSEKKGVNQRPLGRGLFADADIPTGKTIAYLWGSFVHRETAHRDLAHRAMVLEGKEWQQIFLVGDESCPARYGNSCSDTQCSANAEFIQGPSTALRRTCRTWSFVRLVSLVPICAGTEILITYTNGSFGDQLSPVQL